MRRNELFNKNVLRALSIGLSAYMALQPVAVLAGDEAEIAEEPEKIQESNVNESHIEVVNEFVENTAAPLSGIVVENHITGWGLNEERVQSSDEKFNNDETSHDETAAEMMKLAEKALLTAQAAADAANGLTENVEALGLANVEADLNTAVNGGQGAVADVEIKVTGAIEKANAAIENATADAETVSNYNSKVNTDKDSIDVNTEAAEKIDEVTIKDENGKDVTISVDKYVAGQAEKAADAAQVAENALIDALKGDSLDDIVTLDDGTEKSVEELIEDVNKAAAEAEKAADDAAKAVSDAEKKRDAAILEYNKYALMYDKPLYGEDTTYDVSNSEELKKLGLSDEDISDIKNHRNLKEEAKAANKNKGSFVMDDLSTDISSAEKAVNDAKAATGTAEKAAKDAKDYADAAKEAITSNADIAIAKATEAINFEVDAANTAWEAAKAIQNEKTEILEGKKAEYITVSAEQDAIIDGHTNTIKAAETAIAECDSEIAAQTAVKNQQQAIITAQNNTIGDLTDKGLFNIKKSELEKAQEIIRLGVGGVQQDNPWAFKDDLVTQEEYDEAEAIIKKYNDAKKAKEDAEKAVAAADSVIAEQNSIKASKNQEISAANAGIKDANGKIAEAKKAVDDADAVLKVVTNNTDAAKAILDTKVSERDKRKADAEAAYEQAADEAAKAIIAFLSEKSDKINQIEYDKALNAWANTIFEKYGKWYEISDNIKKADDAKTIRVNLNKEYNIDSKIEGYLNATIFQGIVDTEHENEVFEGIIDICRNEMVELEKKLATTNGVIATNKADDAKNALSDANKAVTDLNDFINNANKSIETASKKLTTAETTYNNAKIALENAKNEIAEVEDINSDNFKTLLEKIQEAENVVKEAAEILETAQAANNLAQNYAKWANSLTEDQKADASTEEGIITSEKITVPYKVYRDFVEANYKNDYAADDKSNFTGTDIEDVLYWELDAAGNLTGKYFTQSGIRNGGRYFIGSSFAVKDSQYVIDGYVYTHVVPSTPSGDDRTPSGGGTGAGAGGGYTLPGAGAAIDPALAGGAAPTGVAGARVGRRAGAGETVDGDAGSLEAGIDNGAGRIQLPESKVEDKKLPVDDKKVVTIKDEEVAKDAVGAEAHKMSWWWLLLVALGIGTEETYRRNKKKKAEEKAALDAELDNK